MSPETGGQLSSLSSTTALPFGRAAHQAEEEATRTPFFHQVLSVCSFQAQLQLALSEKRGKQVPEAKSRAESGRKAMAVGR